MLRNKSLRFGALAIGLLLSLLFVFGCSELPNQPQSGESTLSDFLAVRGTTYLEATQSSATTGYVSATKGGTITFPIGADHSGTFEVLPGALESNTVISIDPKEVRLRDKTVLEFEFGPDGLEFSRDAVLSIDADAFDDSDIAVVEWYYYEPAKDAYQLIGVFKVTRGEVVIPVEHFSKYVGISQGGQRE